MSYAPPETGERIELRLDRNEGPAPPPIHVDTLAKAIAAAHRYPNTRSLTEAIAARARVAPDRVLVTAGADDALQRLALATLGSGQELLVATPTFEMLPRYARLAGGTVSEVPLSRNGYPLAALLERIGPNTGLVAVVSPNNPTGQVVTKDELVALARATAPRPLLVDLAYTEFADQDLFTVARDLPNSVVVRTFSKARGLAGLRVGYAVAGS